MAPYRTTPMHRARREFAVLKACAGCALAAFAILGLTGAAQAPDMGSAAAYEASLARPMISRSGTDVIITGSIDNVFLSQSFLGTNKALKQDRARPVVELAEVTASFAGIRARIAALCTRQRCDRQRGLDAEHSLRLLPGESGFLADQLEHFRDVLDVALARGA